MKKSISQYQRSKMSKKRVNIGNGLIGICVIIILGIGFLVWNRNDVNTQKQDSLTTSHSQSAYETPPRQGFNSAPPNLGSLTSGDEHACAGNEQDRCIGAPAIDFYPGGSEDATNPDYKGDIGRGKEIMGRIISHSGKTLVLKTTSERSFSVEFPVDPIETFNTERSVHYKGLSVTNGDMIYVWYTEALNQSSQTVTADRLFRSSLIIKLPQDFKTNPDAVTEKY